MSQVSVHFDGHDLLLIRDGVPIAKRGTGEHAATWLPLQPGYTIRDRSDGSIEIRFKGADEADDPSH